MFKRYRFTNFNITDIGRIVLTLCLPVILLIACGETTITSQMVPVLSVQPPNTSLTQTVLPAPSVILTSHPTPTPILESSTTRPVPPTANIPTNTVDMPSSWASLGKVQPLEFQNSAIYGETFVGDPLNLQRIAYCDVGNMRVSSDGGTSWSNISTAGVAQVAAKMGFPLSDGQTSRCILAGLDSHYSNSFYAVFNTYNKSKGEPGFPYQIAYFTNDSGKTWQPITAPEGYATEQNSGLRIDKQAVQAVYRTENGISTTFGVTETKDGGRTWKEATLECLSVGACVNWGPSPQFAGMGAPRLQNVIYSTDNGQTWSLPNSASPVEIRASQPNQLITLSQLEVALVSGRKYAPPFQLSKDGGRSWNIVTLPNLPENLDLDSPFPGLQMLPNGSLLAHSTLQWYLLATEKQEWCALSGSWLPQPQDLRNSGRLEPFRVISDRLWWFDKSQQPNNTPLKNLSCQSK